MIDGLCVPCYTDLWPSLAAEFKEAFTRDDTERKTYKAAVDLWGIRAQVLMCIEEAGELLQALSKYDRNPAKENRQAILEEIADVDIMLNQMRIIYDDHTPPLFCGIHAEKLARLKAVIEREQTAAKLRGPP